jgi:hypothetical protein
MNRIMVIGSDEWSDRRTLMQVLREVEAKLQPPFTLITANNNGGASRHAIVGAKTLGWTVELFEVDEKCDATCPDGHRRRGSAVGEDYCPTARRRTTDNQLANSVDLLLVLKKQTVRDSGARMGQTEARRLGIAVWERTQTRPGRRTGAAA